MKPASKSAFLSIPTRARWTRARASALNSSNSTPAHSLGLQVNAGHGLNTQNVPLLFEAPHLVELNIGHSIVSRAITVGLATAVKEMLLVMERYPSR
jgi:pyridoxine 5-phosphate synthase